MLSGAPGAQRRSATLARIAAVLLQQPEQLERAYRGIALETR